MVDVYRSKFKQPISVGPDDLMRAQYSFNCNEDGTVTPGLISGIEVIRGGARDVIGDPITNENCECCWHLGGCCDSCPILGDKAVRRP